VPRANRAEFQLLPPRFRVGEVADVKHVVTMDGVAAVQGYSRARAEAVAERRHSLQEGEMVRLIAEILHLPPVALQIGTVRRQHAVTFEESLLTVLTVAKRLMVDVEEEHWRAVTLKHLTDLRQGVVGVGTELAYPVPPARWLRARAEHGSMLVAYGPVGVKHGGASIEPDAVVGNEGDVLLGEQASHLTDEIVFEARVHLAARHLGGIVGDPPMVLAVEHCVVQVRRLIGRHVFGWV
jgi:hypothetical protein